jgi:L-asparagine transporter-like permease
MSDESTADDAKAVWRNQQEEKVEMDLAHFMNRRSQELYASTRTEIVTSIAAAVFFVAVLALRFRLAEDRLPLSGYAAVLVWVLVSLYWFRDRIRGRHPPRADAIAATGAEYYRNELVRRRDHLRNAWLWHGPMFLACMIFAFTFAGNAFRDGQRLWNLLPLFILIALWTVFSFRRRRRQASQIQQEIDELNSP